MVTVSQTFPVFDALELMRSTGEVFCIISHNFILLIFFSCGYTGVKCFLEVDHRGKVSFSYKGYILSILLITVDVSVGNLTEAVFVRILCG